MAATSARTLRLLSLLQARRHWAGAELAERLGISVRTLRRDIDRLRALGYPVDAAPGVDGGYRMAPGASLPPLVLDDEEAAALTVGLLAAVRSPLADAAEASARALGKVVNVLPQNLRRQVEALTRAIDASPWRAGGALDAAVLTLLAQACRDGELVRFAYVAADRTASEREVEPYRLVTLGTAWYLVAFDRERQDWRTFRIDRMATVASAGRRYNARQPPFADAAAFVRSRIEQLPRTYDVDVHVRAAAPVVRQRVGKWARVEETGAPGECRVRFSTDSLDWAAFSLLATAADFVIVAPPELEAHLAGWGRRIRRATGQSRKPTAPLTARRLDSGRGPGRGAPERAK